MDTTAVLHRYDTNVICCYAHPYAPLIEDYHAGDQICSECGLVVGDRVIDVGAEWRTFGNERAGADPCRVGGRENPLLNGPPQSTMIGPGRGGASVDGFGVPKYQNQRTMSSSDRGLINGFKEITSMADRIHVAESIVEHAKSLFKQVHDKKNLKGQAIVVTAAACLHIACRLSNASYTFKETSAASSVRVKKISHCCKAILKVLGISMNLVTAEDILGRFCAKLGLPYKVERAAKHIARKAVELDVLQGRSYDTVAGAAIYMASQASEDKCSQKQIQDVAGVTAGTIRQSYQLMYPHAAKLFPEDFRFAIPIDQLPQK